MPGHECGDLLHRACPDARNCDDITTHATLSISIRTRCSMKSGNVRARHRNEHTGHHGRRKESWSQFPRRCRSASRMPRRLYCSKHSDSKARAPGGNALPVAFCSASQSREIFMPGSCSSCEHARAHEGHILRPVPSTRCLPRPVNVPTQACQGAHPGPAKVPTQAQPRCPPRPSQCTPPGQPR